MLKHSARDTAHALRQTLPTSVGLFQAVRVTGAPCCWEQYCSIHFCFLLSMPFPSFPSFPSFHLASVKGESRGTVRQHSSACFGTVAALGVTHQLTVDAEHVSGGPESAASDVEWLKKQQFNAVVVTAPCEQMVAMTPAWPRDTMDALSRVQYNSMACAMFRNKVWPTSPLPTSAVDHLFFPLLLILLPLLCVCVCVCVSVCVCVLYTPGLV